MAVEQRGNWYFDFEPGAEVPILFEGFKQNAPYELAIRMNADGTVRSVHVHGWRTAEFVVCMSVVRNADGSCTASEGAYASLDIREEEHTATPIKSYPASLDTRLQILRAMTTCMSYNTHKLSDEFKRRVFHPAQRLVHFLPSD